MNYYEILNPYYALIKANNEGEAVDLYIKEVDGNESDRVTLHKEIKSIHAIYAGFKVGLSDIKQKEANDIFYSAIPQVVLVDSSLL